MIYELHVVRTRNSKVFIAAFRTKQQAEAFVNGVSPKNVLNLEIAVEEVIRFYERRTNPIGKS